MGSATNLFLCDIIPSEHGYDLSLQVQASDDEIRLWLLIES